MMHVPESQELLKAQHEYRKKGLKRRGTLSGNPFVELVRELLWMLSKVVRPVVWLFVRVPARLLLRRRTDSRRTPR